MSKYLYCLLAISLVFYACEDDEPSVFGTDITAFKNGAFWTGQIYGGKTQGINGKLCELPTVDIAINKFNNAGFWRESLVFGKIYPIIGTYTLEITQACDVDTLAGANYYTLQDDGDVLGDTYEVLESEDNFIAITAVNDAQTAISGTFQVTFVLDDSRPKVIPSAPDTVRFTNGEFFTRITE